MKYSRYVGLLMVALLLPFKALQAAPESYDLKFTQIPSDILPSNEVRILFQDSDGFIWIPTYNGLSRYDGYNIVNYGVNAEANAVFDAYVNVVVEDDRKMLWIAADKGLFTLHKPSGVLARYPSDELSDMKISDIAYGKDGDIWIGGDKGAFVKRRGDESFRRLPMPDGDNTIGVTSVMEDSRGNLWLAASGRGLYRYDRRADRVYEFTGPELKFSNVLFEDSAGGIWVGTWGCGLLKLSDPDAAGDMEYFSYRHKPEEQGSLLDDIIYVVRQDANGKMWVGGRSGLSILHDADDAASFENYAPGDRYGGLPFNEVSSILWTRDGQVWLSMFGGGVCKVQARDDKISVDRLPGVKRKYKTSSVRSIFDAGGGKYWIGLMGYGMILYDKVSGSGLNYLEHRALRQLPPTSTVDAIIRRRATGEICFGTYTCGLWIYDDTTGALRVHNSAAPSINALEEDSDGNLWLGTKRGVFVLGLDDIMRPLAHFFPGTELGFLDSRIFDIEQDNCGNIWIATNYEGIVKVNLSQGTVSRYAVGKDCDVNNVYCVMADSRGRVWAGSMWSGLSYYDAASDMFRTITSLYTIGGRGIFNIAEDEQGRIWVTTSNTVLSFTAGEDFSLDQIRHYTVADGDENFSFNRNVCLKTGDGRIWFGGTHGLRGFGTDNSGYRPKDSSLVFTDFKVHNRSLRDFPPEVRRRYTQADIDCAGSIVLNYADNNFSIEFSLLDYENPVNNIYIYSLEGYDTQEIIVDAERHWASYFNLPPGRYIFRVRGAREGGVFDGPGRSLAIRIRPPVWASWWAWVVYALLVAAAGYFAFSFIRYRMRVQRDMLLNSIEKSKIEEINHIKLQFFTNITHELMTPLSIILSGLENLAENGVGERDRQLCSTLTANATRLMRLIQQILEFRKVESGNLRICVSHGNLSSFIRSCVEAFAPLVNKKRLRTSFVSTPSGITGYFDPDKLDKIVYNLMSNAAKYTPPDGRIDVRVTLGDGPMVIVEVVNTGEPMSRDAIASLFRRFYEGDYRKHNTIGTGIGLSLVKDLVEKHHGIIEVESSEAVGNCFRVKLPVGRECYAADEVDESVVIREHSVMSGTGQAAPEIETDPPPLEGEYTILVVEDNDELRMFFSNLLSRYFSVLAAADGVEAMALLGRETVNLVVSDVMMPGMDGIELCKQIKGRFEYCHIPVILLTAKTAEENQIEGYYSGADGYVCKPCSFRLLYAQITAQLKKLERNSADFRKQLVFESSGLDYTSMDEEFLRRAVECVNQNLTNSEFNQAGFVREMGMSRSILTEKLKTLTGLTPSAFVTNVRLTTAYKFLEGHPDIRITDLAYAVGFNDPRYFSTCFKKKYSVCPKEWRKIKG